MLSAKSNIITEKAKQQQPAMPECFFEMLKREVQDVSQCYPKHCYLVDVIGTTPTNGYRWLVFIRVYNTNGGLLLAANGWGDTCSDAASACHNDLVRKDIKALLSPSTR